MLKFAVDRNDFTLYNECLTNMGPVANSSTWILSLKCKYLATNRAYIELKNVLVKFYSENKIIRDEEIISIARNFPLSNFAFFEEILDSLFSLGYKIPSRAIHALAERLPNKVDEIRRIVLKYEKVLGDEICFTELELLFGYISLSRESEARNTAINILKRKLDIDFREHVSRLLDRSNWNIQDEAILALKFRFGSEYQIEQSSRKKYSRSISNLVRNSSIVKRVKDLYDQKCQVCGQLLNSPLGSISEAAHIQALGSPHFGPDEIGNILCLCPNHHKLLDNCGIFINSDLEVIETLTGDKISNLIVMSEHIILKDCIAYHRNYCINSSYRKKRVWL
jgi:DNA-directed RNA polymerase subunit F